MSPFGGDRVTQGLWALLACTAVAGAWLFMPHPLLAPALAVAPVAWLVCLRIPFWLCLGFVIFSFFRIHEAFPVLQPFHIPQLLAAPTLAVLAWQIGGTRVIRPYWSSVFTLLTVFFVLVTLGIVFAVSRPTALAYWTSTYVKIVVMVFAIAWLARSEAEFGRASRLFVFAGIAIAAVALFNKASGIGLVEGTRVTIGRDIQSVLGDPNDLSLVLLFPLCFAGGLLVTRGMSRLSRIYGLVGSVMLILAIVATQSRGGLLGVVVVIGLLGARVIRSKVLLVSSGAVALLVLTVFAGISDRQSGGTHEEGIDESAMGRIYAWQAAVRMAVSRPLTGVGLDNFVPNYYLYSDFWDGHNHAVHSTWFGVLGETGFPGFLVFVVLVTSTIRLAYRSAEALDRIDAPCDVRAMGNSLAAGLPAFCVAGTFLTQGFTWPFYVEMALTVAVARFAQFWTPESAGKIHA